MIDYKFNEGELIEEFKQYIDSTYGGHYSRSKFQATEFIFDSGHGVGFTIGNILKYAQRYGKKGTQADARKDLQKILHYTLMAIHVHDENNKAEQDLPESCEPCTETINPEAKAVEEAAKRIGVMSPEFARKVADDAASKMDLRKAKEAEEEAAAIAAVAKKMGPVDTPKMAVITDPRVEEIAQKIKANNQQRLAEPDDTDYTFDTNDKGASK